MNGVYPASFKIGAKGRPQSGPSSAATRLTPRDSWYHVHQPLLSNRVAPTLQPIQVHQSSSSGARALLGWAPTPRYKAVDAFLRAQATDFAPQNSTSLSQSVRARKAAAWRRLCCMVGCQARSNVSPTGGVDKVGDRPLGSGDRPADFARQTAIQCVGLVPSSTFSWWP